MNIKQNQKGFTLVEIVIVLAIAALILAAILFAVQGAQQSRRDAARRDAGGQIGALVEEFAGNHNGTYPTSAADFTALSGQIASRTKPPDAAGWTYEAAIGTDPSSCGATAAVKNTIAIDTAVATRKWQVCVGLESGDWFRANN